MSKTKIHTPEQKEIKGQYAMDWADAGYDADFRDTTGTLEIRGDGNIGFHGHYHGGGLFDQIDPTPDEATGETQDKGSEIAQYEELGFHIGELSVGQLTELEDPGDIKRDIATEQWLKEHDPSYN